jgi:hypothetical protein
MFPLCCLCVDGPYILSCLVQMPLCGFDCLGVVLLDVASVSIGQPMLFPTLMALSQVTLTGYPQMTCIHLMACSVDGRL